MPRKCSVPTSQHADLSSADCLPQAASEAASSLVASPTGRALLRALTSALLPLLPVASGGGASCAAAEEGGPCVAPSARQQLLGGAHLLSCLLAQVRACRDARMLYGGFSIFGTVFRISTGTCYSAGRLRPLPGSAARVGLSLSPTPGSTPTSPPTNQPTSQEPTNP